MHNYYTCKNVFFLTCDEFISFLTALLLYPGLATDPLSIRASSDDVCR